MLISIIVPVYNVAEYLEGCVASVRAGGEERYELLLVDDGSTDRSGAILDRLASEDPAHIRALHQTNRGPGGARNTGIEAARGDYLLFLDSDDTLLPGALARLARAAEETGADILGFNALTDDGAGRRAHLEANRGPKGEAFSLSQHPELLLSLPAPWPRLWSARLFEQVRFPEKVWYEDLRVVARLFALAERVVLLPDELYVYQYRPGSIMNNAKLLKNREILTAMEDITGWYRSRGLAERYAPELCALAVENLYLAASVRVARSDPRSPVLGELRAYMLKNYPNFWENPYVARLPRSKRLALRLVDRRQYGLLRLLFRLKEAFHAH